MKVNIDMTVEVSDEVRKKIAAHLGQKEVDRQGIKDFLWAHGEQWEAVLGDGPAPEPGDGDLIGGSTAADLVGAAIDSLDITDEEFGDLI